MSTWVLFTTFLIVLAAVLMVVIAAVLLPRAMRTLKATFYCPWKRRRVTVRFVSYDGRRPVGVVSCTAFADPTIITCGAPCVSADGRSALGLGEQTGVDAA